ncbi:MAG: carbohydrate kinase [Acidobacteria bacterium]|nr:carbohydrate kinase [Acidobacteriota bacterium]
MPLYLGLDSSTQSLTAVVIEIEHDRRGVVLESSLVFDEALPHYGTRHGVLPQAEPLVATSSPLMWAEALDVMMNRLAHGDIDIRRLAAVSGSAQQHGSVYMNDRAARVLETPDPSRPIVEQIRGTLSRDVAPIWMDSSTSVECAEIAAAVGGDMKLANRTGSRVFERFTGPQIRKFFKQAPVAYAATDRVHLVSSYLASLLAGHHAPLDPGDASGMNLMELATSHWWPAALEATAPGLAGKLPSIVTSWTPAGRLSSYWQSRYGFPPARVIVWSGDNPCSLIGVGLVREGRLAVSLGTSDTVFGLMQEPRVDNTGTGHVFGAPTGAYLGLTCFQNGSLARERVRDAHGLTWTEFSRALETTQTGNGGRVLVPWFQAEITPPVLTPGVHRYALAADDAPANVRAVVEAQQMAMALHSRWMRVEADAIHATGGAAANRQILQVTADVFGADVYPLEVANSAALGAALRAAHGDMMADGRSVGWEDVISGFAEPIAASRLRPDRWRHAVYRELMPVYAACEAHALGRGPEPTPLLERFRRLTFG